MTAVVRRSRCRNRLEEKGRPAAFAAGSPPSHGRAANAMEKTRLPAGFFSILAARSCVKEFGVIRRFHGCGTRVERSRFPDFLSIVLAALFAYSPGAFSG